MSKKFLFFAFGAVLLALCASVEAQPTKKIPRLGILLGGKPPSANSRLEAFRQGLRELGWAGLS